MTLQEQLQILQDAIRGKRIQSRMGSKSEWMDFHVNGWYGFNFDAYSYRVKPEPREWFLANGCTSAYPTRAQAEAYSGVHQSIIHVREVL